MLFPKEIVILKEGFRISVVFYGERWQIVTGQAAASEFQLENH